MGKPEFTMAAVSPVAGDIGFSCNACGKCCNSPPLMSIGELLHHEDRFIGALSLRGVPSLRAGDIYAGYVLSDTDAAAFDRLAERQLFSLPREQRYRLALMTQAVDYETSARCPALAEDNRCGVYNDRKPAVCDMVPFDALYPDELQHLVLNGRRYDEACIVQGPVPDNYATVVLNRRVNDDGYREALQLRRNDLAWEKQLWGDALFASLNAEFLANPAALRQFGEQNSAVIWPLAPVLAIIAAYSDAARERCLHYAERQLILLEQQIQRAIARKVPADKPMTALLRSFVQQYSAFIGQESAGGPTARTGELTLSEIHRYLGA
jgi:Fe-S-cluster containining protein